MPRQSPLPERLRYLQPFRKQAAKLQSEEIDEDMDLSLLNILLLDRIKGNPLVDGKRILEADLELLEKWLSTPGLHDNGSMIFARGYLMGLPELVDILLEAQKQPKAEQKEIQMELPVEAKIKKLPHALLKVRCFNTTLFILPIDKQDMDCQIKAFHETPPHYLAPTTLTAVKFGSVSGFKKVVDLSIVEVIKVEYALEAPGGNVSIEWSKKGGALQAEKFEKYFHTIRIV